MKIPQLKKKPEIKSCHNINWEDNYSWVHQKDIKNTEISFNNWLDCFSNFICCRR